MKRRHKPCLTRLTKQRGDADVFVMLLLIGIISTIVGVAVGLYYERLSLQEVQKLEQKCLEYNGTPEYKKFPDNTIKEVLWRKEGNLYEKF